MYDVVVIGSGAGGGTAAYQLAKAGKRVLILEKGDFIHREAFSKDELAYCRRNILTPHINDEYHIVEQRSDGRWQRSKSSQFFNGSLVGGSSNLMSGMFHSMHPDDFKLLSRFDAIAGANIQDWAIDYSELQPYYAQAQELVGITTDTKESSFVKLIDTLPLDICTTPRAILSYDRKDRKGCYYSNFCGSYGCSSGAKGSAREAFIMPAMKEYGLEVKAHTHVKQLISTKDRVTQALIIDTQTMQESTIQAKLFIVSGQAHESVRLLLNSQNNFHPHGLGNSSGELGKNLIFSAGGHGIATFDKAKLDAHYLPKANEYGYFLNRSLFTWQRLQEPSGKTIKGGIVELMFEHSNPIAKAIRNKYDTKGNLLWGDVLMKQLYDIFNYQIYLRYEIFLDWLPTDNGYLSVDSKHKDRYDMPVGKLRIDNHPHNRYLSGRIDQAMQKVLRELGAKSIESHMGDAPPPNLIAGGARFGDDPRSSVLNRYCQSHDIRNLFVVDASFMPTGGSVPYTWSIYANALRVGEYIAKHWEDLL